jgi:hypothetical protein
MWTHMYPELHQTLHCSVCNSKHHFTRFNLLCDKDSKQECLQIYTKLIHKISLFHDRSQSKTGGGIKTFYLCIQNHTQVTFTVQFTIYRNHLGFIFSVKF